MSFKPPKYQFLEPKKRDEMLQAFHGVRKGWVQVGKQKWFYPDRYIEEAEHYCNFKARPDDTFVVTYPRSGTTWTQELVWLIANNMDFESASKSNLDKRYVLLERSMTYYPELINEYVEKNRGDSIQQQNVMGHAIPGYEILDELPSPRFIKSHLPISLLPTALDAGCKIVYVARNPKDVAVSYYHFSKSWVTIGYQGEFSAFWDYFERDLILCSPYWEHLKEAWALRHQPNVLFLFYEELKTDLPGVIRKVAQFLGKTLTEEQVAELADHLDIKNFRNNQMVNMSPLKDCGLLKGSHIRNGQCGGWKDYFTPELEARADKWIDDNLKDTDFTFPHLENKGK